MLKNKIIITFVYCGVTIAPWVPYTHIQSNFAYFDIIIFMMMIYLIFKNQLSIPKIASSAYVLGVLSLLSYFIHTTVLDFYQLPLGYIVRYFYFSILLIVTANVSKNANMIRYIFIGIIMGGLLTIFYSWFVWSTNPNYIRKVPMLHVWAIETEGTLVNRNYVGYFIATSICVVLGYIVTYWDELKLKFLWLIILGVFLISSILTFSKGALLGSFTPVLILLLKFRKDNKKIKIFNYILVGLLFIVAYLSLNIFNAMDAFNLRIEESQYTNDIRLQYYSDSASMMLNNLIYGVGPKNYYSAAESGGYEITIDPHNVYLWVGSELGILGLIIILIIVFYIIKKIKYSSAPNVVLNKYYKILYLIGMTLFLDSFISGLSLSSKLTWILIGILASYDIQIKPSLEKSFNA